MSVPVVLFIILFILMVAVGGKKGAKSFFTLCFNFLTLFFMILLIALRLDPIYVTICGSIIICSITLFYINGTNKKTISALISVTFVVLLTMLITYKMGSDAKIQGFSYEQRDTTNALFLFVNLNFSKIVPCEILIGLLGAVIDVAISISSSMNEILKNNPSISKNALFRSGINIGKDILGTMTNTLLFAYIGGSLTLIIWYSEQKYTFENIINGKMFCSEIFQLLCSGIGIILIIPVTALVSSIILFAKLPPKLQQLKSKF